MRELYTVSEAFKKGDRGQVEMCSSGEWMQGLLEIESFVRDLDFFLRDSII